MIERKELYKVISKRIPGEWGDAEGNVKVLRTANFTNDGKINFSNVVSRKIDNKNLEKKKLIPGDIIIEKSGGGPKQPVGRVVFFDREDDLFLCNNFTAILRCNQSTFSKYLFYYLFSLHKMGVTLKFQNKTTGIINLKLDKYLEKVQIPLPPLPEQKRIAAILDKADALRQKNKKLLAAYDELLQSVFLDMFGDPVTNPKGWEKVEFENVIIDIVGGHSVGGEQRPLKDDEFGVLKVSAVTTGTFLNTEFKAISKNKINKPIITPRKGDLLFSRANTRELVGAVAVVDKNYNKLFLPDKLWRIDLDYTKASQFYCHKLLSNSRFRPEMSKIATGTSGSMLNISKAKLRKLRIPLPPVEVQNKFAQIVENIEAQKALIKQSLIESEDLFNGLVQKAFNGELK